VFELESVFCCIAVRKKHNKGGEASKTHRRTIMCIPVSSSSLSTSSLRSWEPLPLASLSLPSMPALSHLERHFMKNASRGFGHTEKGEAGAYDRR